MTDEDADERDGSDSGDEDTENGHPDAGADTVPEVELSLYQVSVRVRGRGDDGLSTVEETAIRLVDHLVERAETLEEEPDKRGLG
ncbi:hypothetical protein HUG10_05250 [Halorarum halophilum]|uniref:Uncharacterized protein n=1 Tax=Halorarum halophilum TaxID=2743090 RepID=A0A7D5KU52_9EURY|nr:hypothetical protein [Halobaculum halophilum]QLG26980.1 hypothetical protein HUG10_05250 [Halobaculum halophilum]